MIHLYTGDGKGKTTAGYGLCLRMAGQGGRAAAFSFLKCGGGELNALKKSGLVRIFSLETQHGFYKDMAEKERQLLKREVSLEFDIAKKLIQNGSYKIILLDEVLDAVGLGLIDKNDLIELIKSGGKTELILTGRSLEPEFAELADYHTLFMNKKHPYQKGMPARRGIEF